MVTGKPFVRARKPGTGSVRPLLVGRLMRRERSAARAATNTTNSAAKASRKTAAVLFTSGVLASFVPSGQPARQTVVLEPDFCQRIASRTATYCRTLPTSAGSALEWRSEERRRRAQP